MGDTGGTNEETEGRTFTRRAVLGQAAALTTGVLLTLPASEARALGSWEDSTYDVYGSNPTYDPTLTYDPTTQYSSGSSAMRSGGPMFEGSRLGGIDAGRGASAAKPIPGSFQWRERRKLEAIRREERRRALFGPGTR